MQSALIRDCLPGFSEENRLTVLDASVLPRIWLGNAITTPTHLDEWNNIGLAKSRPAPVHTLFARADRESLTSGRSTLRPPAPR